MNSCCINLEIKCCDECPFFRNSDFGWFCARKKVANNIEDPTIVPDDCPFVLGRLQGVLSQVEEGTKDSFPKKYLLTIRRKQKELDPNPKFGADHAFDHAKNVAVYGNKFLRLCLRCGKITEAEYQKYNLMLQIASWLHDVGLAETTRDHASRSVTLIQNYLAPQNGNPRYDIDLADGKAILHAIANHSSGLEINNVLDAALIMGDKLDVTRDRIIRVMDKVTAEVNKVKSVKFGLVYKDGQIVGTELRYRTLKGFDRSILSEYKKPVEIPYKVSKEFLGLPFNFYINNYRVDLKEILGLYL